MLITYINTYVLQLNIGLMSGLFCYLNYYVYIVDILMITLPPPSIICLYPHSSVLSLQTILVHVLFISPLVFVVIPPPHPRVCLKYILIHHDLVFT